MELMAAMGSHRNAKPVTCHPRSRRCRIVRASRYLLLAALFVSSALAQRAVDIRAGLGAASFVDEGSDNHGVVGASARFYLTRRFSVEPEIVYMWRGNSSHRDWLFMPNVAFDFRSLDKKVVPYVIGGVGYLRITDGLVRLFTVDSWVAEAGGGAKIYLNRNVFLAPEVRIGSELYVRAAVSVGYTFGR